MPIPPKLSRKLHEILGNEAADAMADWMNQIDGTHSALRADIAELRHEMDVRFATLEARMDGRFASQDAKITALTEEMRVGFANMDAKISLGFANMDAKLSVGFANADAKLSQRNFELMKWAFGFWIGSLAMVSGAMALAARFGR